MQTRTGRTIEVPNPPAKTKQALTKNAKVFDRRLLCEALREAAIRQDFHAIHLFVDVDYMRMTDGERTSLNEYLFGVESVPIEKSP
jgi:hypothetical protein